MASGSSNTRRESLLSKLDIEDLKSLKVAVRRRPMPRKPPNGDNEQNVDLIRKLDEPHKLVVHLRPDEGLRPIFDRDDVKVNLIDCFEERVIVKSLKQSQSTSRSKSRSRSIDRIKSDQKRRHPPPRGNYPSPIKRDDKRDPSPLSSKYRRRSRSPSRETRKIEPSTSRRSRSPPRYKEKSKSPYRSSKDDYHHHYYRRTPPPSERKRYEERRKRSRSPIPQSSSSLSKYRRSKSPYYHHRSRSPDYRRRRRSRSPPPSSSSRRRHRSRSRSSDRERKYVSRNVPPVPEYPGFYEEGGYWIAPGIQGPIPPPRFIPRPYPGYHPRPIFVPRAPGVPIPIVIPPQPPFRPKLPIYNQKHVQKQIMSNTSASTSSTVTTTATCSAISSTVTSPSTREAVARSTSTGEEQKDSPIIKEVSD